MATKTPAVDRSSTGSTTWQKRPSGVRQRALGPWLIRLLIAALLIVVPVLSVLFANIRHPEFSSVPTYWPTTGWQTSTPEEQGIDSQQLTKALQHIDDEGINVRSLTIIRNGYVVLDTYRQPFDAQRQYQIYSVTKSVTGSLIGIAIKEGYIKDVKQPMLAFFPTVKVANRDANKEAITIEDLLTMQPGLDCADEKIGSTIQSQNWVYTILDLPMASPPGKNPVYCTAGVHLLSAILTKATGMSAAAYAQSRIFAPLGITKADYTWPSDPQGISIGGYGLSLKPHDMAKLGLLYLNGGKWEGKQIVPEEWMATSSRMHSDWSGDKDYGYLFWVYPTHFAAEGLGEQKIQVVKDRNMVVVMTAAIDWTKGAPLEDLLRDYIIPAARSDSPLPANNSALHDLQAKVESFSNPVRPVPALSETAKRVSGKTYTMPENNPMGAKSLRVAFEEGKPEAQVLEQTSAGPQTLLIGLDNVYRLTQLPYGEFAAFRGQWVSEDTFVVRELFSSSLEETEFRLVFTGDEVKIHVQEMVFGSYTYDLQGTAEPATPPDTMPKLHPSTSWDVRSAPEAYEALCFINALTGDQYFLKYYQVEYDHFMPLLTPEARQALKKLTAAKEQYKVILSATFSGLFSSADPQTIGDLLALTSNPSLLRERVFASALSSTIDDQSWKLIESFLPDLATVLTSLRDAGFGPYLEQVVQPVLAPQVNALATGLVKYRQVVPLVEQHTGIVLPSDNITVYVTYFSRPNGIRLTGARFIQEEGLTVEDFARTAIHEMLHAPFSYEDQRFWDAIGVLQQDEFVMDKILHHNPDLGYNSFQSYVDEDSVRALTQLISEQLGIGVDAKTAWGEGDDGMHVLTVALYSLMKQQGFTGKGEKYADFIIRMVAEGKLAPGKVKELYDTFYRESSKLKVEGPLFPVDVIAIGGAYAL